MFGHPDHPCLCDKCVKRYIVIALLVLIALCVLGTQVGCVSTDPTEFRPRYGCIYYPPAMGMDATFERVQVIADIEKEGEWLVVKVDSSSKEPMNIPKDKVRFFGCPGNPGGVTTPYGAEYALPDPRN